MLELCSALAAIPNASDDWQEWNRIAMAVWAATGGTELGFAAFNEWCRKWAGGYDPDATRMRWDAISGSPPNDIGAGTIFKLAKENGWTRPKPDAQAEFTAEPGKPGQEQPQPDAPHPGWNGAAFQQVGAGDWEAIEARAREANAPKVVFNIVRVSEWEGRSVGQVKWVVQDWLPVGFVTLLYGPGGIGKTLLLQQLLTSTAMGLPFMGIDMPQMTAFGLFCEDPADTVLHPRQGKINRDLGISYADTAGRLEYVSLYGEDTWLTQTDSRSGNVAPTHLYQRLREHVLDVKPGIISMDVAGMLFDGNENDRKQVSRFVQMLTKLGRDAGAGVVLTAHPSREGVKRGTVDSGSTGWEGSARSRWTFTDPKLCTEPGKEVLESGTRLLKRWKANYAPREASVSLMWADGVFALPDARHALMPDGPVPFDNAPQSSAKDVFLMLLDKCTASGIGLSATNTSGLFAPRLLSQRPDCRGFTVKELESAMHGLFADNAIRIGKKGKIERVELES